MHESSTKTTIADSGAASGSHKGTGGSREPKGTVGSVATSAVELWVGPLREAAKMSHRIMNLGTSSEVASDLRRDASPSEESDGPVETHDDRETDAEQASPSMEEVWGVGPSRADALRKLGIDGVEALAEASIEEISELSIVGAESAQKIRSSARDLVGSG